MLVSAQLVRQASGDSDQGNTGMVNLDELPVKCRKLFGVERRDLWCVRCRWKKSCMRMPGPYPPLTAEALLAGSHGP